MIFQISNSAVVTHRNQLARVSLPAKVVQEFYAVSVTNNIWETRDLPVLRAIVEMTDEGTWHMEPGQLAERTGLDLHSVKIALIALTREQPPLFSFHDVTGMGDEMREIMSIHEPTGHARRTVGVWPRPEHRVEQLVQALIELSEQARDPEERRALKRAAVYIGNAGRDLVIGILSNMAAGG